MKLSKPNGSLLAGAGLLLAALTLTACGGGGSSTPAPTPQTITFAAPGTQTTGTAPPALSAVATSGLAVTIASTTPAVCTVSGTTLALVSAGTCSLSASQAGNGSYAAAPTVTVSFSVLQAQTITFPSPGNQALGTAAPALAATASSGLAVAIASRTTAICTVSGTTLTLVAAGTCTLSADQAGNATYAAAVQTLVTFTVSACVANPGAANDLVSFDDPTKTYTVAAFNGDSGSVAVDPAGGCNHVGTVTRSPGSQYDGATFGTLAPATSPTIATIPFTATTNTLTLRVWVPTAPTLVHLKIENAANGAINYETEVNATVANSWQTLTFSLNAPLVGGLPGQAFNLANTYNRVSVFFGFGGVQGASPATYYFDDLTLASGSGGPAQTITFTSPGNQTLGAAPPALVATATSGLLVTLSSKTTSVCTVSGSALTLVAAGTCTLAADQAGNATYNAAPEVTVTFNVAAAAAPSDLVSFDDPSQTYTVAAFNGDTGTVAADPAGGGNHVGAVTRTPGSQYDGATFGTLAPATSPTIPAIPFTATTNRLTLRVYVPAAPTLVHLKIENAANGAINYETEVNATQANSWQTLTFSLSAPLVGGLPGQAFNLANTYNRVSVFFGFGSVQGASAATFYFDDLSFAP